MTPSKMGKTKNLIFYSLTAYFMLGRVEMHTFTLQKNTCTIMNNIVEKLVCIIERRYDIISILELGSSLYMYVSSILLVWKFTSEYLNESMFKKI